MTDKPVPTPSEDTTRFWDACNDGRFVVQRCTDCGHERFYPAAACPNCWHTASEEVELDGSGTVESFTVVHPRSDGGVRGRDAVRRRRARRDGG